MSKIHVLLVDDHPVLRVGLRTLIENERDMEVVGEAGDGDEAVLLAERLCPDVVVMDISMPGTNGLEATRRIRKLDHRKPIQVLVLTVHAQERYLFPVLQAGGAGYLLKSSADTELIDAIRVVAKGGAFLYPSATRLLMEDYLQRAKSGEEQDSYELLGDRERDVLRMTAEGYTGAEIAEKLSLSPKTVETYRSRIMEKLGLHSRADLVRYALRKGLLSEAQ
ncbi:MAG: response regulator transcription factor [Chloroflexi bacterium]|nr:response regulator transcription factor [Chloroflexota bacterium]MDA8187570.1 response regulator transcription factor [Dehalococcoidales bacterium]